ncbi:MAG: DNA recombination protein RmuC [Planctomyces sp.]
MEIAVIVLSLLSAALAALAFVLVRRSSQSAALLAGMTQRAEEAERAAADFKAERDALRAQAALAGDRIAQANAEAARLNARLAALDEQRRADSAAAEQRLRESLASRDAIHAQELASKASLHQAQLSSVQQAQKNVESKLAEFSQMMEKSFGQLAGAALERSQQQLLELSRQRLAADRAEAATDIERRREAVDKLIAPIAETLRKTDEKLAAMEQARTGSYATLSEQVRAMQTEGAALRQETARLVRSLREPQIRGRYGEVQLKRVAELAGMRPYCDFKEQDQTINDSGQALRPDMIVQLPNGRELVIDAKANLKPYLDAMEATSPQDVETHLRRYADGIVEQATKLARKDYYQQYKGSPDFVVMFLPGDQFLDAALSRRPDLLESAAAQNVLLASPASLIAMLRAVAVGFREQRLAQEAEALLELGRTLHERARVAFEHVSKLGDALESAVKKYNEFCSSYESRLEPTLRQFEAAGVRGSKDLPELAPVVVRPRALALPDAPGGRTEA